MRWNQGRGQIERLPADGHLKRVQASGDHADRAVCKRSAVSV
jgi:hypothetical protein